MPTPSSFILAIDQGTTSTKALVIDEIGQVIGRSRDDHALQANHPQPGWVENDPRQLFDSVLHSARSALDDAGIEAAQLAGLGLANQGESVIAFDSDTGEPIYPAISWQDRRGGEICGEQLDAMVNTISGLRLKTYFSAPKLAWIARHQLKAKRLAAEGRLRMGTTDAWLLWQLTGGQCYITDVATASRTALLDLETLGWSPTLLDAMRIDAAWLPRIVGNAQHVAETARELFGAPIPITGLCVDQQAALFGHRCFEPGSAKATYGTGCFVLTNVGSALPQRVGGLLTCAGWRVGSESVYALDGGVYTAGATVEWLLSLGLIGDIHQVDRLALGGEDRGGVAFIPALCGLGAPHWEDNARAAWVGMTQHTQREHLVRAAVESIAFRVREIVDAMRQGGLKLTHLSADGGLTRCQPLMQWQADLLNCPIHLPSSVDQTALGVGLMAGLGAGVWPAVDELPRPDGPVRIVKPASDTAAAEQRFSAWRQICNNRSA